jgi:hypothetical protein
MRVLEYYQCNKTGNYHISLFDNRAHKSNGHSARDSQGLTFIHSFTENPEVLDTIPSQFYSPLTFNRKFILTNYNEMAYAQRWHRSTNSPSFMKIRVR